MLLTNEFIIQRNLAPSSSQSGDDSVVESDGHMIERSRVRVSTEAAGFFVCFSFILFCLFGQGQLFVQTLISVSVPHPRVTAVVCKRSRSFCQKCR